MEQKMELIDRQAVFKEINRRIHLSSLGETIETRLSNTELLAILSTAPIVDAVPVVHGKWVDRYGGKHAYPVFECSVCKGAALLGFGCEHITQALSAYCPCCGAKMDQK